MGAGVGIGSVMVVSFPALPRKGPSGERVKDGGAGEVPSLSFVPVQAALGRMRLVLGGEDGVAFAREVKTDPTLPLVLDGG